MPLIRLETCELAGPRPGPTCLITGGVHGDEFEPMAAIRRLARSLPVERLTGRVRLIPVVNEPAFCRGTRTAEDGLDLARTCPGSAEGSITERIAAALSSEIQRADFYIDLHTGGTCLRVWPLVGYMLHPAPEVLDAQRRMARAFGLPVIWGTDHRLQGRSLSVARDAHVPAIYAEYHGGGMCDFAGVEAYVRGCRQVLIACGMLDEPAEPPPEPLLVVEDDRPNSGHMQLHLPAPCDGFFETRVQLGQALRAGDELGTVSDACGSRVETIRAPYDGIVLVLRTFCRVAQGDSLGVVLGLPGARDG